MKKLKGATGPISNIFKSAVFLLAVVVLLFGGTLAVQEVSAGNTAVEQLVITSATADNQLAYVAPSDNVPPSYNHLVDVENSSVVQPKIQAENFRPVNDHGYCSNGSIAPLLGDPQIHEQTETGGKGGQQVPPTKDFYKVSY